MTGRVVIVGAGGFGRLQPAVDRFFDDPRLQRLFSFQAMYAGLSSMRALAMYSVITYLDTVQGVYFARSGVHELASGHYSPSCLLWLVGGQRPEGADPAHHTIHFGAAWSRTFSELLDEGRPPSDPSRFVTTPSVTDPELAPAGRDVLHVLEPVPNLRAGLDWQTLEPQLTERMLTWLAESGHLGGSPEVLHTISPVAWAREGMGAGTPFSLDHCFTQTGPLRPGLTDRRLPGVVFVGSATRPGVGVPMVLISGRLAADRVVGQLGPRSAGSQRPGWQGPTGVAEVDTETARAS